MFERIKKFFGSKKKKNKFYKNTFHMTTPESKNESTVDISGVNDLMMASILLVDTTPSYVENNDYSSGSSYDGGGISYDSSSYDSGGSCDCGGGGD